MIRDFNNEFNRSMITLLPGEWVVSSTDIVIAAQLSSGISVVLFDLDLRIGGLNHFAIFRSPDHADHAAVNRSRYGEFGMADLIESLESRGCRRLRAQLIGGGMVPEPDSPAHQLARENVESAKDLLDSAEIPKIGIDVGGPYSREVIFLPFNGVVITIKSPWLPETSMSESGVSAPEPDSHSSLSPIRTVTSLG